MYTVKPSFKNGLKKFGIQEWNECYHCGNCTAICPLSEDNNLFPRKSIRNLQMGLQEKVESNLDPWLCYYCGECTETCPRDANPGELMMSMRRYLTSVYDWTGISKLFYTNKKWELLFIGFFSLLVLALFMIFLPPSAGLFTNPELYINAQGGVAINNLSSVVGGSQFVRVIEYGDWIMAITVGLLLISNILHMWYKTIIRDNSVQIPFLSYFTEFWKLIVHFAVQPRFSKCEDKNYWYGHFLMMSGYTIMFIMIVTLLPRFQVEEVHVWYHWQRILGYYATFGILIFLINVSIKRFKQDDIKTQFSHLSDWLFIILLLLTTITGILIHIFRLNGMPLATYILYVMHLAILVPMIMVEVPFSKWSHLAYRPFAIYFNSLKASALAATAKAGAYSIA